MELESNLSLFVLFVQLEQTRSAMQLFLRSLPVDCFFNIVSFGSDFRKLWTTSRPYNEAALREASLYVTRMSASMGGTALMKPLSALLGAPAIPGYGRQVFVLTDGQVNNTSEVVALVRHHGERARVFALGLGDGASHELVDGLAEAGNGTAEYVLNERVEAKVIAQLKDALHPSMSNVVVRWEGTGPAPTTAASVAMPASATGGLTTASVTGAAPEMAVPVFGTASSLFGPLPSATGIPHPTAVGSLLGYRKADHKVCLNPIICDECMEFEHHLRSFDEPTPSLCR